MVLVITCIFKLAGVFPYLQQLKLLRQQVRKYRVLFWATVLRRVKYLLSLQVTLPTGVQRSELQDPRCPTSYTVPRGGAQDKGGKSQWALACPVTGQGDARSEEQVKSRVQPRPVPSQWRAPGL